MKRCIALILLLFCVAAAQVTTPAEVETGCEPLERVAVLAVAKADDPVFVPLERAWWETHELVARVIEADIFRPPIA